MKFFKKKIILSMLAVMILGSGCADSTQEKTITGDSASAAGKYTDVDVVKEQNAAENFVEESVEEPAEEPAEKSAEELTEDPVEESKEESPYLHLFKNIGVAEEQNVEFIIYSTIEDVNQQPKIGQYTNYDITDAETQYRVIKDLNVIKAQKIGVIEQSFDKAIDINVDQTIRYWRHESTRILYDAESDTYILKKYTDDDDWYQVMEGKEACEDLFFIAQQYDKIDLAQ